MHRIPPQAPVPAFALLAALLLAGCGLTIVEPDEPVIRGPIVSIQSAAGAYRVQVDALPGGGDPCGIVTTVDDRTRILVREPGGGVRVGSLADLAVGDTVAVFVRGAVAESCPLQGLASTIEKRLSGG